MSLTVSNSEVDSFLQCEMKHWFAHILKVQPNTYSDALTRGIIGHEALEQYYIGVQAGDVATGERMMTKVIEDYMRSDDQDSVMLVNLLGLLNKYVSYYDPAEWKILAIEKSYHLPFTDDLGFGMRLDLLVELQTGYHKGELSLVDHKFVYDFWSTDDLMLNAQIPKYLGTLQANGVLVKHGIVNQLRHRTTKAGLSGPEAFRRETITPSRQEIINIMREQVKVSEQIAARKALTVEAAQNEAVRVLNKMSCKNCSFRYPCKTSLVGESIELMLATEYQPNDYVGYTAESVSSE